MADSIVQQLFLEFRKVAESTARVSKELLAKVEAHEREQQAKLAKFVDGSLQCADLNIDRLKLEKEQNNYEESEKEMVSAENRALEAEKHEQVKVDELESTLSSKNSDADVEKEQSMREMYQDMIDKLAEMHTLSRQSQRSSLANERFTLDEQVSSLSQEVDQLRHEVDALNTALNATGYEGLLHETQRSAMLMMKNSFTEMKNELLQLRLATHTLRIKVRSA
ncbi:unnamed protein product [Cylicocyclus nassatus]|uniref:Uncharacterized protein n=1 Tax=Cylicocyclus nassatus TaxID=53992 RepID=A0AA36MAC1_CYLNA|nr:unnamed protein product [Cylicocyclus nassatus]